MNTYYIKKNDFADFVSRLSKEFKTYYLKSDESDFYWKKSQRRILYWQEYKGNLDGLIIGWVRANDPLKQFIFSSKEKVSEDFKSLESKDKPLLLIGAKNCDLASLDILDYVFMQGDFKDPFYINRRQSTFIIASDCTEPLDICFCKALGREAFPTKNYDMALADIGEGYVVEIGSQKALDHFSKFISKFMKVSNAQLEERQKIRRSTNIKLDENIKKHQIPQSSQLKDIMKKGFSSGVWEEEIKTCVECGCCNFICPTCHCFFLGDSKEANRNIRHKIWDACLYKDFAVVAGGANPRKRLFQRLRNRYDKKFEFFPNVLGMIACTGCGRCISGCPAKIDIRRILKNLVAETAVVKK